MHAIYADATKTAYLLNLIRGIAGTLRHWDLDWDVFPDLSECLDENWKAPYGRDQAEAYLGDVMSLRSSDYWRVWQHGRPGRRWEAEQRLGKKRKAFDNVCADLAGDELQGKW